MSSGSSHSSGASNLSNLSNVSRSIAQAAVTGLVLGAMSSACGGSNAPPQTPESSASATPESATAGAKECCKGKNECKGQGGCKTATNDCAGMNDCKLKGGCNGHCPKE